MSDEVRLRDVVEADLETFFQQACDPEAVRRAEFPARERDAFMTHWRTKVMGDTTGFVQAVTVNGELAGNIVAWWAGEQRFLGYWLGRQFWGRGIGTRALGLFLQAERNRPLFADPYRGNTASVRLLEKHGFRVIRQESGEHPVYRLDA
ncbi:N-acetyltransferase [Pseudonocardiaceae bacterium YIM PH 21723]|nr:N-acetyltransferase [Pseudonocardiaceae bacterium YIM PH 21723]